MSKTYLLYTDDLDAGEAKIYVEMGECAAVPVKHALVTIDGVQHVVIDVVWDVYVTPSHRNEGAYPQQCATVLLRSSAT